MPKSTAEYQRQRRAALKKQGYKQLMLTLDPQSLSAARYIHSRMGGDLNHIIRAALLTQAAVLNLARTYRPPS